MSEEHFKDTKKWYKAEDEDFEDDEDKEDQGSLSEILAKLMKSKKESSRRSMVEVD